MTHPLRGENRRLADILSKLPSTRVLVVGDLILDRYADGKAGRVSPEAPVLVFDFSSLQDINISTFQIFESSNVRNFENFKVSKKLGTQYSHKCQI